MAQTLPVIKNDKSGGFFVVTYTDGSLRHNFRVHVAPFVATPADNPPVANDYRYAAVGSGQEATVGETIANLVALLKQFYPAAFKFNVQSLWRNTAPGEGGGSLNKVYPRPKYGPIAGTNGGSFQYHAGEITVAAPTRGAALPVGHGRGILKIIGSQAWNPTGEPEELVGNVGGNNLEKLVAYLGGMVLTDTSLLVFTTAWPTTQIVGHDGTPFLPEADLTYGINRRQRRTLGYIGNKYNMTMS